MMMNGPMMSNAILINIILPNNPVHVEGFFDLYQTSGLPTYWSFICQQRSGSKESQDLRSTMASEKESDALVAFEKSS